MDFDSTGRVLAALEREGVRYVVIGAAAINLLGPPRATQDLDIFIAFDDLESKRVKFQGIMTSVATPGTLYRRNKGTVRLKDQADAALLKERFKLEDS